MADSLVLKTNTTPTYFNKEAAIGLLLFPPLGAAVGAVIGKNRMESEAAVGKPVKEPSFWNMDTLLGTLIGGYVGTAIFQIAAHAAIGTAIAAEITAVATAAPVVLAAVAVTALVAGPLVGMLMGGNSGKERMQQEYVAAAVQQQREQQPARSRSDDSPEQYTGINYSQDHAKNLNERQQSTAQQRT